MYRSKFLHIILEYVCSIAGKKIPRDRHRLQDSRGGGGPNRICLFRDSTF